MEDPNRRSFLIAAFALAVGGCAGGYFRGGMERVVTPEKPRETRKTAPPKDGLSLPKKDPLYPGSDEDGWIPDLNPISRSLWAPGSPINRRLTPMGRIHRITIHHEGAEQPNNHTGLAQIAGDLRDIRKVHLRVMGAGDIGYHYIIDRAGRIWSGRPSAYQGAHSGGEANVGNLGIMCLGNFDLQEPSRRQTKALHRFLLLQMRKYGVPCRNVFTHQELKPTRCPGRRLQAFMNRLRTRL
jgi:hypothetical protein